jgi:excisionase family DNA binding protein
MTEKWLTLSEAAQALGVHPSTVRSWADQGGLPTHRTRGGHRRFRQSDIELWIEAQRVNGPEETGQLLNSAIRRVRLRIGEGALGEEYWYQKLNDEARDQYRRTSRSLVLGLNALFSEDEAGAAAEARALGHAYSAIGRRHGLNSVEAVHAFLFFRTALLDSVLSVYEDAAVGSPLAWGQTLRRINEFTDQIMIKLLENYHAFERGNA